MNEFWFAGGMTLSVIIIIGAGIWADRLLPEKKEEDDKDNQE
jgi:hypothetical protein